ncbi:MAG: trigger factor [Oscillospiraceae bacterium]|nr:trigger factor [Oscillospiraceae bacterium]
MAVTRCECIETNKYELEFTVDAEGFEAALQKAYNKEKKNIAIPGFRKGKVPRALAEKYFGENAFYETAVNILINERIFDAIDEAELKPIAQPEVEVTSISKEEGVVIKATCINYPEVTLGEYKGITAAKPDNTVTDEQLDSQLEMLRRKGMRLVSVERAAENDDNVNIDFEGFVDEVAFEGGKAEGFDLKLGSGQFIPGFEDQIVGHNVGDEFDVNVTFPEEYHVSDLAGKPAVFKVKLNEIRVEELPELDDELVKDYSDFNTVDEYKADCKERLEAQLEARINTEVENAIFRTLIDRTTVEIPDIMIEDRITRSINDFESRLMSQGMRVDTYLQYTGMSMEDFRESYRAKATDEVKLRLALEKIAEIENLEVSEEEIEKGLAELSKQYNMPVEKIKQLMPMGAYHDDLLVGKASELVKENAVITDAVDNDIVSEAVEAASAE